MKHFRNIVATFQRFMLPGLILFCESIYPKSGDPKYVGPIKSLNSDQSLIYSLFFSTVLLQLYQSSLPLHIRKKRREDERCKKFSLNKQTFEYF